MAVNHELRQLIEEMAEVVRQLYDVSVPIYDIEDVVKKIGGVIIDDPLLNGFSDGRIKKTGPNSFEIAVSPFQTMERRNFTVAHELGHLFLHMGYRTSEKCWQSQDNTNYYRNGNSELEYQSNEFAAAFLMPRNKYREIMDQYTEGNTVDTAKIAKYFQVSVDAAANRGKWLGYLRW